MPRYDGTSSFGVGKGYIEKPAVDRKISSKLLPWPFGPHVVGYK